MSYKDLLSTFSLQHSRISEFLETMKNIETFNHLILLDIRSVVIGLYLINLIWPFFFQF